MAELAEWTVPKGLENNAEMVKEFYTHMVFDTGDVVVGALTPKTEVLRVVATKTRNGQNITWTGIMIPGTFLVDTTITAVWMVGKKSGQDVFLCCHRIMPIVVNTTNGMKYEFPYTISGYMEDYNGA